MRQQIVAGNWKMNTLISEGEALTKDIIEKDRPNNVSTIICPPFTHLSAISALVKNADNIHLGAQDCSPYDSGAYTGQNSAAVLKDIGVEYVIIGHSERRNYQGENDEIGREKIKSAIKHGLNIIFCCGETLMMRQAGIQFEYVLDQVKTGLFRMPAEHLDRMTIAYEPIWAIGTGKVASADQAQEMHAAIRQYWGEHYGSAAADKLPILYGGSCKPSNAQEIFAQTDVDGGLIGGASLNADAFMAIHEGFAG